MWFLKCFLIVFLTVGITQAGTHFVIDAGQPEPLKAVAGEDTTIAEEANVTLGGSPSARNGYGVY